MSERKLATGWRAGAWRSLTPALALRHLTQLEQTLTAKVGPATSRNGEANAAYLDAAGLSRVGVEFRYTDYQARLSAMNFGERGVRVRESYQFSGG